MWDFLDTVLDETMNFLPVWILLLFILTLWLVSPSKPVGNDRCCYREERVEERQRLIDLPTVDQKDDKRGTSDE